MVVTWWPSVGRWWLLLLLLATTTAAAMSSPQHQLFDDGGGGGGSGGELRSERSAFGMARKLQFYVKHFHLQVLADGTVNGTLDDASPYTILQRTAIGVGKLKIQGIATCQYLCMDACGLLYGSRQFDEECVFNEMIQEQHYNTYSSTRYSNAKRTLYLALNRRGAPRKVLLHAGRPLGRLAAYTRVLTRTVHTAAEDDVHHHHHHHQHHHHQQQQQQQQQHSSTCVPTAAAAAAAAATSGAAQRCRRHKQPRNGKRKWRHKPCHLAASGGAPAWCGARRLNQTMGAVAGGGDGSGGTRCTDSDDECQRSVGAGAGGGRHQQQQQQQQRARKAAAAGRRGAARGARGPPPTTTLPPPTVPPIDESTEEGADYIDGTMTTTMAAATTWQEELPPSAPTTIND